MKTSKNIKHVLRPKIVPVYFASLFYFLVILFPSLIRGSGAGNLLTQILTFRTFYDYVSTLLLIMLILSGPIVVWILKYPRIIVKPAGIVFYGFFGSRGFIRWNQIRESGIRNFLGLKHLIINASNRKGSTIQFFMPLFLVDLGKFREVVLAHSGEGSPLYKIFFNEIPYNRLSTKKMIGYSDEAIEKLCRQTETNLMKIVSGDISSGYISVTSDGKILSVVPELVSQIDNPFTDESAIVKPYGKNSFDIESSPLPYGLRKILADTIRFVLRDKKNIRAKYEFEERGQATTYIFEAGPYETGNGKVTTILILFQKIESGEVI